MAALGVDLFQRDRGAPNRTAGGTNNSEGNTDQVEVPQTISCSTTFRLFYLKQNPKKPVWKSIASRKAFKISFEPQTTTFADFQQLVATMCDGEFTSAGPLIRDAITTGSPPIDWSVYLLRCPSLPEFNKGANYLLCDIDSFNKFIDAATSLGKDNIDCGLKLQMEDRGAIEKQAAATVEIQNHLSTVEAARHSSTLRRKNREDSVEPDLNVFEDTVNLHMEKLYDLHRPNMKYDRHLPIFLDPGDSNRYIPMTLGVVQEWAKALNSGVNGVSLNSPPSSIKFVSLTSKKRKVNHSSGSNNVADILVRLLGDKNGGSSPTHSDSNCSSAVQSESGTMADYLEFIKIRPEKQAAILEILDHNDIDTYKLFQSKSISQAQMSRWGLSDGIIAQLRDNVRKYEKHAIHD